ncbi:50S ribosome-binding GTPase [Solwaraspora sp. WMMD1047]|uniref:GTPase n=1 Tax=Solwaraspora sp. WMMD1047 TaxID=3016102 RepID=UPI0024174EAC|nr:GTPase [Solwaraspora sp. WMMD1047]MDG4834577.1 50S ribosome-binding GTPase [Solwaraspora sp. WMMD1047]
MTDIVSRVRESIRGGGQRIDIDSLINRLQSMIDFIEAVDGHLPDERLVAANTLIERAGTRLALSGNHTVVALAGATGSGKSSLFNMLARFDMSPVGVRRPTTGTTYACVWGPLAGASELLDWVGVLPRNRFVRESPLDGEDEAALHGLVLLDLPDFDSVELTHRLEVDRLLGLVDLVVWVVDPQKYADRVVHQSYLREFRQHKDVTVVVLNHADRLPPAEVPRVGADLRRLLDADQLEGVPVLATSALHEAGIATLRGTLEETVAQRQAMLRRLSGDVDKVVEGLTELVRPESDGAGVDRARLRRLTDALAALAGVPTVASATEQAYRHRAAAATGWPLLRGWRRFRPDPLRRLHLAAADGDDRAAAELGADPNSRLPEATGTGRGALLTGRASGPSLLPPVARTGRGPVGVTSLPAPTAAERSAVSLAVRAVADQASAGLPAPWPTAVTTAARSRLADLPDALDRAVARIDLPAMDRPLWWRLVGAAQWLVTLTAAAGLAWLLAGIAAGLLGFQPEYPTVGVVPVPTLLLLAGLLLGFLIGLLIKPVINVAARRARDRVAKRLRAAVTETGHEYVVAPVHAVLAAYEQARNALIRAGSRD